MRTHLKLDGFYISSITGPTRLAPITLLLGANSLSKSSLIQRMLLIRQTVKGPDYPSKTSRVFKNGEPRDCRDYRTQRDVLEAWDALQAREAA